jgi:iron(III) transport system substrate-binding protein
MKLYRIVVSLFTTLVVAAPVSVNAAEKLVVYSARNEQLIGHLFETYTKVTGVEVKFITDKAPPLLARLKAEGKNTPADVLITVDAGNLWKAAQEEYSCQSA